MKTKSKIRQVGKVAVAVTCFAANSALASNVTGEILADNGSIAVLQQGSNYNVIPGSVSGSWPGKKTFEVDVPDNPGALAECRIHVIAWGDGSDAQGVLAHFAGTAGSEFTGKPGSSLNNVGLSSVTFSGGNPGALTDAQSSAQAIIMGAGAPAAYPQAGFTSQPAVTGGIPGTWGPVNLSANLAGRNQVAFVWNNDSRNLGASPSQFRVISTPCVSVVRPVKPPRPQAHVPSWEIAGQFNSAANPFEVWSYGYKDAADCTGPFVKFTNAFSRTWSGQNFQGWRRGPNGNDNVSLPEVAQSTPSTVTSPLLLSPKGLTMHPGPQGQCAVVRFTAPDTGTYELHGRFWAQNDSGGGTNTTTMVVKTPFGGSVFGVLDSGNVIRPGTPSNNPFHLSSVGLNVGDAVDFMVGANGSFSSDSTGLHGYIERITP